MMGLALNPGHFRCSYFRFTEMRHQLARAAGYAVWPVMTDLGTHKANRELVMIDWGHITPDNLMGIWKELPGDPLLILLAHHDHTGVIKHEHCKVLADRLLEVRKNIASLEWLELAGEFQRSLEIAHDLEMDVHFV